MSVDDKEITMSAEYDDVEQPEHRNQSIHRRNFNRIAEDEKNRSIHVVPDFDTSGRKPFATKVREMMDENMRPRTG